MTVLNLKSELHKDSDKFGNPLNFAFCYFQNSRRRNFEFCASNENYFLHESEHKQKPVFHGENEETYSILSIQKDIRNFHQLPLLICTDFGVWKISELEGKFYPKIKFEKINIDTSNKDLIFAFCNEFKRMLVG